jgi:hypothetical protein
MLYRGIYIDGNEPHRKHRLAELVDDLPGNVRARIKSLYDHKGSLTVRWFDHLYEPNRAVLVEQAWNRRGEPLIAHVDEKSDMDHDTFPDNLFEDRRPI